MSATFVWITCPFVLRRLKRDADACNVQGLPPTITSIAANDARVSATTNVVKFKDAKRLILEELDLRVDEKTEAEAAAWAKWFADNLFAGDPSWQSEFTKRFAIVSDDVFTFLAEFATEVNAHIRIDDESGIVYQGALWYQECLPAESVLAACFHAEPSKKKDQIMSAADVMKKVSAVGSMQLGGKATTGLGVVRLAMVAGAGA